MMGYHEFFDKHFDDRFDGIISFILHQMGGTLETCNNILINKFGSILCCIM
jgi:hypothetical protein